MYIKKGISLNSTYIFDPNIPQIRLNLFIRLLTLYSFYSAYWMFMETHLFENTSNTAAKANLFQSLRSSCGALYGVVCRSRIEWPALCEFLHV